MGKESKFLTCKALPGKSDAAAGIIHRLGDKTQIYMVFYMLLGFFTSIRYKESERHRQVEMDE